MPEQAIVLSLLNTGVRRAELAGLTWSDFDLKECTVHVNKSLLVLGTSAINTQPQKKATTVILM